MPTSKAGLNSQAYSELQLAVANLQAQIDNLGGTQLVTTSFSGFIFVTPTGLDAITIPPPPTGQRVVLEGLTSSLSSVPNVSVVGSLSGAVINDKELSNAVGSATGRFSVGTNVQTTGPSGAGIITKLIFEPDETVSITKTGAAWSGTVYYSYSYAKDA